MENVKRLFHKEIPAREDCLTRRLRRMVKVMLAEDRGLTTSPIIGFLQQNHIHWLLKGIWLLIFILCLALFGYQTYERINYFLKSPVAVDVFTETPRYQILPEITICSQETEGVTQLARKLHYGDDCLVYPAMMFIQMAPTLSVEEIWKQINTTTALISTKAINSSEISLLSYSESNQLYGICTTFRTKSNKPVKTYGGRIEVTMKKSKVECEKQPVAMVFVHDSKELTFSRKRYVVYGGEQFTGAISVTKFVYVNRTKNPCVSSAEMSRCWEDCFVRFANKTGCRLPFHPVSADIPVCNQRTATEAYMEYFKMFEGYTSSKSEMMHCTCTRKCQHRNLELHDWETQSQDNQSVYSLEFGGPYETVIQERLLYGFIQLLCDVGGNSGLSLGLSVLSLFEIIHAISQAKKKRLNFLPEDPLFRLVVKTNNIYKPSRRINQKEVTRKGKPKPSDLFRWLFTILGVCLLISGIFIRSIRFIQNPTRIILEFSFKTTLVMPSLIACFGHTHIMNLQQKYAKLNNVSNFCEVNFWELLDLPGVNTSYLWQHTYARLSILTWHSNVNLYDGPCIGISTGLTRIPPYKEYTLAQDFASPLCGTNYVKIFVSSMYLLDLTTYIHYPLSKQLTSVRFVIKEIALDETRYDCTSEIDHKKCRLDCLHANLLLGIKCRLPYMPESDLGLCNSSAAAKHSHMTYLQLLYSPEKAMGCNCLPPCRNTLYELQETTRDYPESHFNLEAGHNIIVTYLREPADSIVKFLCDVGGWLGTTLGLCILSTAEVAITKTLAFLKTRN